MNKIASLVKKEEKKSLSGYEILKALNGKTNLITYPQIHEYKNIQQLLGKHGACVILYMTKENYGHWCCVFRRNAREIEFFDPYGIYIDDELNYIPKKLQKESDQDYPYLTKLLYDSRCKIIYNEHKLQKFKKNVNSCGRWVICRIWLKHIPLEKFVKLFQDKRASPDFLVTALTLFI
jgi:hypothetical protein